MAWHDMIWYNVIGCDRMCYDMIWHGMRWHDMIWNDVIWCEIVWDLCSIQDFIGLALCVSSCLAWTDFRACQIGCTSKCLKELFAIGKRWDQGPQGFNYQSFSFWQSVACKLVIQYACFLLQAKKVKWVYVMLPHLEAGSHCIIHSKVCPKVCPLCHLAPLLLEVVSGCFLLHVSMITVPLYLNWQNIPIVWVLESKPLRKKGKTPNIQKCQKCKWSFQVMICFLWSTGFSHWVLPGIGELRFTEELPGQRILCHSTFWWQQPTKKTSQILHKF